ncbi:hypothetical protein PMZ80_007765 [Knufia obscura]|uniref:S-adenosyl-L-methionine-dependent methyltransferase n=2 Tax=Knufia TaxID=430999 RepID=A0AAN8EUX2_9EURO|nr:hypothetical protein PMZ80_007765 [Knufia obscura]KAK5954301.1 hypothetical protein OHC33_004874 [Knufia fluminis]
MSDPASSTPLEPQQGLQPDNEDNGSAVGDDLSTLTHSVRSSIYDFHYENGRRYHAYGKSEYLIPNDEDEQNRLDLVHHMYKMVLGGELYTTPLEPSSLGRILDVGTGTGIWAIEMADQFPAAVVIRTDISPIQPSWVPPNCSFYIDDAETRWTFEEPFDFIHGRALCGAIADWPEFDAQAHRNLKPGGWLEMQEYECCLHSDDDTLDQAPLSKDWLEKMDFASSKTGKRLNVAHLHRQWMIDAGFVEVEEQVHKIPIGGWPKGKRLKGIGKVQRIQMIEAIPTFSIAFYTRVLGYSLEQAQIMVEGVKVEFMDKKLHMYLRWHFVRGRRAAA